VGRNESENERIVTLARRDDLLFQVQGWGSPVTLLRGKTNGIEIAVAAAITARYSDAPGPAAVCHGVEYETLSDEIWIAPLSESMLRDLRV
jgi:hypothetical protein